MCVVCGVLCVCYMYVWCMRVLCCLCMVCVCLVFVCCMYVACMCGVCMWVGGGSMRVYACVCACIHVCSNE